MSHYVIVETGDAADPATPNQGIETATNLAANGHDVTLFLVQNGVFFARRDARYDRHANARNAGITVLADDFSLRERGIGADQLSPDVSASPLESIVDRLAAGNKVLWH